MSKFFKLYHRDFCHLAKNMCNGAERLISSHPCVSQVWVWCGRLRRSCGGGKVHGRSGGNVQLIEQHPHCLPGCKGARAVGVGGFTKTRSSESRKERKNCSTTRVLSVHE
ncbi:hypothetical protein E2C01_026941 [Portunus trituberculatus]|uniref:Uncharacterized protein n=1 Tax=Portunus trituberculatus TaxID=210409 RepID=A0A5B7EK69_PORTR|nr:hypothetical protein [Portunus trituberculatus]